MEISTLAISRGPNIIQYDRECEGSTSGAEKNFLDLEEHLQVEIPEKHPVGNCGEIVAFMALRKRPLLSIYAVRRTTKKREMGARLVYEASAPCFNCRLLNQAILRKDE